jgi:small subunit ribosomal protein S16
LVKIRLTRLGKHKAPFYRIVAMDSRVKRDGKYIALIGTLEPRKKLVRIDKQLALKYLSQGAQPSDTVLNLFKKEGVWAEFIKSKVVHIKPKKIKKSKKAKPAPVTTTTPQ